MTVPNFSSEAIPFTLQPTSGRVYSAELILVAGTSQSLDLRPLQYQKQLSSIQGIFIDNSANSSQFSISTSAGLNFVVPPASQAMAPLLLGSDLTLIVSGSGTVRFVLTNFPMPAAVWSVSSTNPPFVFSGNALVTSDQALDAIIANGMLPQLAKYLTSADAFITGRKGIVYSGELATATTQTIIAGSPASFISDFMIRLDPASTLAAAGNIKATLAFSTGGTIWSGTFAGGTAVGSFNGQYSPIKMNNLALIGALAGSNVTLTLSAALATGGIEYTLIGGTTGQS